MWFRRLLLSYLPVFFIVTMILFVVFFQTLNEQNRREAIKANDFLAQQVILFTDNSLKAIDYQVVREILTNPDISRFFSRDSMDVAANIQALKVMDELKFNYPIIDSIYFLRFKTGIFSGMSQDRSMISRISRLFSNMRNKQAGQSGQGSGSIKRSPIPKSMPKMSLP